MKTSAPLTTEDRAVLDRIYRQLVKRSLGRPLSKAEHRVACLTGVSEREIKHRRFQQQSAEWVEDRQR